MLPGSPAVSEATAAAGGAPAFLSSSSLSDPPEELLSEATRGAFLPSPTGQAPEEALTSAAANKRRKNYVFVMFFRLIKTCVLTWKCVEGRKCAILTDGGC